jgi:hypothetical protein
MGLRGASDGVRSKEAPAKKNKSCADHVASLGLALLALRAAGAVDPGALLHDVQSHVQTLAGQREVK